MNKIVLGRTKAKVKEYGEEGSIFIGKLLESNNPIYFDVSKPHITLICGKRGSGKSYTQSSLLEGFFLLPEKIKNEISVIVFDTMGIFWSLKYPNRNNKELLLLDEWKLKPVECNINIFVPRNLKQEYIFHDKTFSIIASEISSENWCLTFAIDQNSPQGICLTRVIKKLKDENESYDIDDIIEGINKDKKSAIQTKESLENRFEGAKNWGIFSPEGTPIEEFLKEGKINILDISKLYYSAQTWNIRCLVVSLLCEKILNLKMKHRQNEQIIKATKRKIDKKISSQLWIFIDEAHQFLPSFGLTPASWPLKRIIREGRQPGISLVLASQQPGKLDSDVITQSDIVISHHITSKVDLDGLNKIMNTYIKKVIQVSLNQLPKKPGAALVIDDTREFIETIQVRPKLTSHAGESPDILRKIYDVLE